MNSVSANLRFTILEHDHPFLHWDLLMQQGEVLATWRLLQLPETKQWLAAEKLPNHRMLYLDYEGPVSGDRGHVVRFCTGRYRQITDGVDGAGSVSGADEKHFHLADCAFASRATCRFCDSDQPQWRFE